MGKHIITEKILGWYSQHQRSLPWRQTTNPYKVWLSEIILQQTRVSQGLPYYESFIREFPDVTALANADEDEVLRLWQGLGYYSRARNLHKAAKQVINDFDGQFPNNYDDLLKLKGVGDYTASAIASFCFKANTPVVDGNVMRVVTRLFNESVPINTPAGHKFVKDICHTLIDQEQPDIFNQAIMEFGALQCTPANPNCSECPLKDRCLAYGQKQVSLLPVKKPKNKPTHRWMKYYIYSDGIDMLVRKRMKGIWQGLFEFPMNEYLSEKAWKADGLPFPLSTKAAHQIFPYAKSYEHILTHQRLHIDFLWVDTVLDASSAEQDFQAVGIDTIDRYAIPRVIDQFWEDSVDWRQDILTDSAISKSNRKD